MQIFPTFIIDIYNEKNIQLFFIFISFLSILIKFQALEKKENVPFQMSTNKIYSMWFHIKCEPDTCVIVM